MGIPSGSGSPEFLFTDQQRKVIEHTDGALLVAAGPGTGKTRVIVERIANLVERQIAMPKEILALTFGGGAVTELRHRVVARLHEQSGPITFSTFHSFGFRLLRQHHKDLGYPTPPRFITTRDQIELIRRTLKTVDDSIVAPISRIIEQRFGPQLIADEITRLHERPAHMTDPDIRASLEAIATEYQTIRRQASLIDHAAMVPEAVTLLKSNIELAHTLQQQFKFVIVDEYQDTSVNQDRLLELLAPAPAPLMVVGDDDQSIYAFRGTTSENLQAFAERRNASRIDLNENWRCGSSIQNAASTLIAYNTDRLDKAIRAHPSTRAGSIEWMEFEGLHSHARALAQIIDDEIRINQRACRDIAVLWRTLSHPLAALLLDQLLQLDIPARIAREHPYSVGLPPAIAELINLQTAKLAPLDDSALGAILESVLSGANPMFGQRAQREAHRLDQSLEETISRLAAEDPSYQPLADTVEAVCRLSQASADTIQSFLYAVWIEFPALRKAARALSSEDIEAATQARRTIGAFNALIANAEAFTLANPAADISMWKERLVADISPIDEQSEPTTSTDDVVLLMTVHQAKGLEWPVVLIPAMEEGVFPTLRANHSEIERGPTSAPSHASIEEERRLFYVALTRAMERAVVSHDPEGHRRPASPSRFLPELGIEPIAGTPTAEPRTPAEAEVAMRQRLRHGTPLERGAAAHALSTLPLDVRRRWWISPLTPRRSTLVPVTDEVALSVTGLTDFRACPYRFRCQHVLALRGVDNASRGMGTIVHAALRDFHAPDATHSFEASTLKDLINRHWDDGHFPFVSIAEQRKKDAHELTEPYVRHHGERGRALAVEEPFEFDLGELRIRGRIDAIFGNKDSTEIVDFKTGRAVTKKVAADDLQLGLYSLAFDHAINLAGFAPPQRTFYLYLATLGPRATGIRDRSTSREDREVVAEKVISYASSIRSGNFPTKGELLSDKKEIPPGDEAVVRDRGVCRYCDFKRVCPDYSSERT
jgi:DNA helicase-2/ATP-dependent DNA helicase PcrA